MTKSLQVLLCTLLALVAIGCGSGDNSDVLVLGGREPGRATGNLIFNLVRAQTTVPNTTAELKFKFLNSSGVVLGSETRPFAAQLVFTGVSDEVVRVEVTAVNADDLPIASGEQSVVITGGDQEVTLVLNAVTLSSLTVEPTTVSFVAAGTQQISIQGSFSNGELMFLDPAKGQYSSTTPAVATVSAEGLITSVNAGTTTINVSYVHEGQTTNATAITVTVFGTALNLSGGNTFDTTTGLLNGAATTSWDGARLLTESFDLQAGATLTVTGSNPFDLEILGDGNVLGDILARGSAGGVGNNGAPGGLGGAAGPGGFVGGNGGGVAGTDGQGPGGGGGGVNNTTGGDRRASSGGGGGHSVPGDDGVTVVGFTDSGPGPGTPVSPPATADPNLMAGLGGAAYASLPPFIGGSGGGGGSFDNDGGSGDDGGGGGGGGGGAVRISSRSTLTVAGTIDCSGGQGGGAENGAGGGGGAGGSIWLRAVQAIPSVTGTLNVDGGAQSPRLQFNSPGEGGAGAAGRTLVEEFTP